MKFILHYIYFYLAKLFRMALKYPRSILFAWIFISILLSPGLSKLRFLLSINDLVDKDFKTYEQLQLVSSEFKDTNSALVLIEGKDVVEKKFLCDLQTWILKTSENNHELIKINSSFGVRQPLVKNNLLKLESVLNVDCEHPDVDEREKITAGYNYIQHSPWKNSLSSSKPTLTISFSMRDASDPHFGQLNLAGLHELQKDYEKQFANNKNIKSTWAGNLIYQDELQKAFQQTQNLNLLLFVIVFLVFRIFLKSWKAGLLYCLTMLTTLIATYSVMGLLNIPIDVLTNAVGLMIMVSCLEDFVFVVYGIQKWGWTLKKSLRKFLIPSFFTSFTTFIGFGSLITSDLSLIRRFGVISAIAALTEWFVVFILLTTLIKIFPKASLFKIYNQKLSGAFYAKAANLRGSRWVARALCCIAFISLFFIHKLRVEDSPDSFFGAQHIVTKNAAYMKDTLGWISEQSLVFDKAQTSDQNKNHLQQVYKLEGIATIEDPYAIDAFLGNDLTPPIAKLVQNTWHDSTFSKRLISENSQVRAQIFLPSMKMDYVDQLIQSVHKICPQNECFLAGPLISYNEFGERVLNTLFSSLGLSLILVIFVILLVGQKMTYRDLFLCIISSMWGPLALLAVFIIFDIPLFFISSICASVLVGLAGDNAMQFILAKRNTPIEQKLQELAPASLINSLGMILMSTVFLLSVLSPLVKLSWYIMLGYILIYLGDVWILKVFLRSNKNE